MGGLDKGLVPYRGYPLIVHAARRLAPQVAQLVISANRSLNTYAGLGYAVVPDLLPGFLGPLAGMHAALSHLRAEHEAVLFVPCDSPEFPLDLSVRLGAALRDRRAAVVSIAGTLEPAFALVRCDEADAAQAYLARGGRKLLQFFHDIDATHVPFDDATASFVNVNTPDELSIAEADPRTHE
jgi:molybdopterin-guanine dinucleotide biosynthesis protein A